MRIPSKSIIATGALFIFVALFHIPDNLFRYAFDKSATAQFISITTSGALFLIYIALHWRTFSYISWVKKVVIAFVSALIFSALLSGNIIGAFFGDSGRFVGVISTLALLVIAIYHTRFTLEQFITLLKWYLAAVELVVLGGFAQKLNLIQFPGAQGFASTLGNTDFYAAFVATSLPLFFFIWISSSSRSRIVICAFVALNIFSLYLAGPLQAWVDLSFMVIALLAYKFRQRIPRREISLNKRTYLASFAVVIWAEFIFLMPFLGDFIPVLGNDEQVRIRGNFWVDGIRQFFSHPILGVGPDQYGNYYEKFRTINDLDKYPNILSNDAHSSAVQTLATLGILGTLLYVALIAIVIRALLLMWDNSIINRKYVFALSVYIFIYLTNSFISPITLSHKYLFWAVCGFIVGRVYLIKPEKSQILKGLPAFAGAIAFITAGALFANAQYKYLQMTDAYGSNPSVKYEYKFNPVIPCSMYFDAEFYVLKNVSGAAQVELANNHLKSNPRCVSALIAIATAAVNSDDVNTLRTYFAQLDEVAPYRSTTLSFGMFYASRVGDVTLAKQLQERMNKLGLVYVPGRLG